MFHHPSCYRPSPCDAGAVEVPLLPWQDANRRDLGSVWCAKDGLPSCTSYKVGSFFSGWEGFQVGCQDDFPFPQVGQPYVPWRIMVYLFEVKM